MSGANHYLIASDGAIYPLRDLGVTLTGLSDIPVEYQTTQGYQQDGTTVVDWRLTPRTLSFAFAVDARDPRRYEAARAQIINVLRPNLGTVTYRRILPGGGRRDIDGWLNTGLALVPQGLGISMDASLSLLCPDPTFYDPAVQTGTLAIESSDAFVLPFAVPDDLWFGAGSLLSASLAVAGTFKAYPIITITGPYERLRLANNTTGAYFILGVSASASDTVVVDLTPGARSITRNGADAWDEIEEGNLVDWYLEPGTNELRGNGSGFSLATTISVAYNARYIAL